MPAPRLIRASALTVALVLLVGGLGYATGRQRGATPLTACSNAQHRLQVAGHNGACPHGYHKIKLNQAGPRGPRGATGDTGPGAWAEQVRSTSGSAVQDHPLAGAHLIVHVVCGPGSTSGVYLEQDGTDDQSSYRVTGTASVSSGGSGSLVFNDGVLHNTPLNGANPQPVDLTEAFNGNGAAAEVVDGLGTLSADLVVTRGATSAAVHIDEQTSVSSCFAQAVVTPLT